MKIETMYGVTRNQAVTTMPWACKIIKAYSLKKFVTAKFQTGRV